MKQFELAIASAPDLQQALNNLKSGIIKQFGQKNMIVQQIFISQQIVLTVGTIQHPSGQQVLIHNVIALLIDQDNDVQIPADPKLIPAAAFTNGLND